MRPPRRTRGCPRSHRSSRCGPRPTESASTGGGARPPVAPRRTPRRPRPLDHFQIFDRPEKRPNRGFVPVFLPVRNRVAERIERMRIRFPESRRARSTEVDEVPAHAERVTDVRSERPYIGPGFTSDAKQDGSPVDLDRLELVHNPRALLALHG